MSLFQKHSNMITAHPFLPTSIQGASQSMEDGVALAITLERSGKGKVQQAVRAYEAIRYERVHRAQMTGVSTREQWHKADWEKIRSSKSLFAQLTAPGQSMLTSCRSEILASQTGVLAAGL
jgi:2-polyprenyl-6-methoxyphenol hydroxylase-like FAD-dependent oxidoreductase